MELRKTKGTSRRMLFGMVAVLGVATMGTGSAAARPLSVVAAENTWGSGCADC